METVIGYVLTPPYFILSELRGRGKQIVKITWRADYTLELNSPPDAASPDFSERLVAGVCVGHRRVASQRSQWAHGKLSCSREVAETQKRAYELQPAQLQERELSAMAAVNGSHQPASRSPLQIKGAPWPGTDQAWQSLQDDYNKLLKLHPCAAGLHS